MRFRDLLLEYDRQKTVASYGVKLWLRLKTDPQVKVIRDFARAGRTKEAKLGLLFKMLEATDPTPNKQYVQWLARCYAGGTLELEDFGRAQEVLSELEWYKDHRFFKTNTDFSADIGRHSSLKSLEAMLDLVQERRSKVAKDEKDNFNTKVKSETEVILDTAELMIVVPKTVDASVYWGQGTRWCTATGSHNQFSSYNKQGPLYIVIDKTKPSRKWQLHFESGQFMDRSDNRIAWRDIPEAFWVQAPIEFLSKLDKLLPQMSPTTNYILGKRLIDSGHKKLEELAPEWQVTLMTWGGEEPELVQKVAALADLDSLAATYAIGNHWDQGPIIEKAILAHKRQAPETHDIEGAKFHVYPSFSDMAAADLAKHGTTTVWRLAENYMRGTSDGHRLQIVRKMIPGVVMENDGKRWYFAKQKGSFQDDIIISTADHRDDSAWAKSVGKPTAWLSEAGYSFLRKVILGRAS